MYTYACSYCSRSFLSRKKDKKFCSSSCYNNFRNFNRITVICNNCSEEFFSSKKSLISKFCSVKCCREYKLYSGKLRPKYCETCNLEFRPKVVSQRFCSYLCSNIFKKTQPRLHNPSVPRSSKITYYKDWRSSVFLRDDYTCKLCNIRGGYLEAHHIYKFSNYSNLRLLVSNGVTLCKECHNKTKRKEEKFESMFSEMTGINADLMELFDPLYIFYDHVECPDGFISYDTETEDFIKDDNLENYVIKMNVKDFMKIL